MRIIQLKLKAFSSEPPQIYKIQVDGGVVRVWDSVAGYFTSRHRLTPSQIKRVINAAR